MPTYIRITIETDLSPIDAIDAIVESLHPNCVALPPDGVSHRSMVNTKDGVAIGTMAIYSTPKKG